MPEFMKVEAGDPLFLADFPQACVCGAQKAPIVATGIRYRTAAVGSPLESSGHVYLCRLCVTRAARALGLVKGEEQTRLQDAADELAQAAQEISTRQQQVDELTRTNGVREAKINALQEQIERQQAEISHYRMFANQIAAQAKDAVAA